MPNADKPQVNEITRRLEALEIEGQNARAVIVERSYPTDIEDLWQAITDPQRLRRWFLPVSGDLQEGGRYQLEGNAGGNISMCDAPNRLQLSWEINGGVSWVHVSLHIQSAKTTLLTLEHISHEDEQFLEFWEQFGPGAVGVGWDLGLLGLANYLQAGDDYETPDEASWTATPKVQDFIKASSADWVKSAIEYGTNQQVAELSGRRTTAFYTGDEFKE